MQLFPWAFQQHDFAVTGVHRQEAVQELIAVCPYDAGLQKLHAGLLLPAGWLLVPSIPMFFSLLQLVTKVESRSLEAWAPAASQPEAAGWHAIL